MTGEFVAWLGNTLITLAVVWVVALPLVRWGDPIIAAIGWWLERWRWTWPVTAVCGFALTWIGLRV